MKTMTGEAIEIGAESVEASRARQGFRALVDAAAHRGRRVTITRNGRPLAALVPLRDLERLKEADRALDKRMLAEQPALDPADSILLEDVSAEPRRGPGAAADPLDQRLHDHPERQIERLVTPRVVQAAAHRSALRLREVWKGSGDVQAVESEIERSLMEAIEEKREGAPVAEAVLSGLATTERK
jgi:prevent-host-death family protein